VKRSNLKLAESVLSVTSYSHNPCSNSISDDDDDDDDDNLFASRKVEVASGIRWPNSDP
jgi:hypothetical protein